MSGTIVGTYFPGIPAQDGIDAVFCAVCVQDDGPQKSYAVYVGIVSKDAMKEGPARSAALQWVMDRGSKRRWREAVTMFPALTEETYRH